MISFCIFKCDTSLSLLVINIMESIIGTVLEAIIINGLRKLRPIDNDNNVVFKIKGAYLHLFNLTYLFFNINMFFF